MPSTGEPLPQIIVEDDVGERRDITEEVQDGDHQTPRTIINHHHHDLPEQAAPSDTNQDETEHNPMDIVADGRGDEQLSNSDAQSSTGASSGQSTVSVTPDDGIRVIISYTDSEDGSIGSMGSGESLDEAQLRCAKRKLEQEVQKTVANKASVSYNRLQEELTKLTKEAVYHTGPKGDNIYEWVAILHGPVNSPYEGGIFLMEMSFSAYYPFTPPTLVFRTRIYHCNINNQGQVQLPLLCDDWSSAKSISDILRSTLDLLTTCNIEDALIPSIAQQYQTDRKVHGQIARDWTRRFAT